jgi:hypothetical protein
VPRTGAFNSLLSKVSLTILTSIQSGPSTVLASSTPASTTPAITGVPSQVVAGGSIATVVPSTTVAPSTAIGSFNTVAPSTIVACGVNATSTHRAPVAHASEATRLNSHVVKIELNTAHPSLPTPRPGPSNAGPSTFTAANKRKGKSRRSRSVTSSDNEDSEYDGRVSKRSRARDLRTTLSSASFSYHLRDRQASRTKAKHK